jgi:hypothetical protein
MIYFSGHNATWCQIVRYADLEQVKAEAIRLVAEGLEAAAAKLREREAASE